MAYAVSKSVAAPQEAGFAATLMARLRDALARREVYRRTLRELNALTSRDLADLNIHASQIRELAREAAYGVPAKGR